MNLKKLTAKKSEREGGMQGWHIVRPVPLRSGTQSHRRQGEGSAVSESLCPTTDHNFLIRFGLSLRRFIVNTEPFVSIANGMQKS